MQTDDNQALPESIARKAVLAILIECTGNKNIIPYSSQTFHSTDSSVPVTKSQYETFTRMLDSFGINASDRENCGIRYTDTVAIQGGDQIGPLINIDLKQLSMHPEFQTKVAPYADKLEELMASDTRSMNALLKLEIYEKWEEGHPGYVGNITRIIRQLRKLQEHSTNQQEPFTIMELGAGPGALLTKKLGTEFAEKECHVMINEYDPMARKIIKQRQQMTLEGKPILSPKLEILDEPDVNTWMQQQIDAGKTHSLNAIVSNFALHHLSPSELGEFFKKAGSMLKPGGRIISGEEYLDESLAVQDGNSHSIRTNAESRAAIQIAYHGRVIEEAWKEGKIMLPGLEFQALVSGLKTNQDFFPSAQCDPHGGNNNAAVNELGALIARLKSHEVSSSPEAWDAIEKDATLESKLTPTEARGRVLGALEHLRTQLEQSAVSGLDTNQKTLNPVTGDEENLPRIDRKITIGQFAEIARESGFTVDGFFTGAHPDRKTAFADITRKGRLPQGGVAVTIAYQR